MQIQFVTIPEVSLSEYAEQLGVSNEEALAYLDADVPKDKNTNTVYVTSTGRKSYDIYDLLEDEVAIDDHLDCALELE